MKTSGEYNFEAKSMTREEKLEHFLTIKFSKRDAKDYESHKEVIKLVENTIREKHEEPSLI